MTAGSSSTERAPVYVALLHHSMVNKRGESVTTAITNLDIHDISRSARTYGVKGYYLVNPEEEQQRVANRIMGHWQSRGGFEYNPDRSEAFGQTKVVSWLKDAISDIEALEGEPPRVVMTSARTVAGVKSLGFRAMRSEISETTQAQLLVFGTGWGIEEGLLQSADAVLLPIRPDRDSGYLHLSVRAAAAIVMDRLLGAHD